MSATYGAVVNGDSTRTARGGRSIQVWAQTETGRLLVELKSDGSFVVAVVSVENHQANGKYETVYTGQVPGAVAEVAPKAPRKPRAKKVESVA